MKKYEYKVVQKPNNFTQETWLNHVMGDCGWQLVYHNDGHTFIFMREI